MINIYGNEGGIPILFIRYNPDNYRENGVLNKKLTQKDREIILIKWLKHYENFDNIKHNLSVHYLFYDNHEVYGIKNYEIKPDELLYENYVEEIDKTFYSEDLYNTYLEYNVTI